MVTVGILNMGIMVVGQEIEHLVKVDEVDLIVSLQDKFWLVLSHIVWS